MAEDPLAHVRWDPPTDPRDIALRAMNRAAQEYERQRIDLYYARCAALNLVPGRTIVEFRDMDGKTVRGAVDSVEFNVDHSFLSLTVRKINERIPSRLTGRIISYYGDFSKVKIVLGLVADGLGVLTVSEKET